MIDRTGAASAIDLPAPRLGRTGAVLDHNGKIGVLDHGRDNTANMPVCTHKSKIKLTSARIVFSALK